MKKIYFFLVAMVVTSLSYGQGSESFANSNATGSYADNNFVGDNGVTWTYVHSRNANNDANGSGITLPALMLRRNTEPSSVTSSAVAGGIGDFSVNLYKGFTGGGDRQVELFVNGVSQGTSTPFDDNAEHTFSVTGINIGGNVTIEIRNITGKQVIVDNISWTGYAGPATPSINITSPADTSTVLTGDVNVSLAVNNFIVDAVNDGNGGHIHYTVDGGSTVMKYDTNDIMLTGLSAGAHTVVATLVDDTHNPIPGPVSATVNFTVQSYTQVADISALRAGTLNDYYELTGEALITYQQGYRNQKFIEDATGAILIDDNANVVQTSYNRGDGLSGLRGQLTTYGGMMQFVPSVDPGAASSTGGGITPQVVTLADLTAMPENYESELVTVVAVNMDNTTPNFSGGSEHQMTQGVDNFMFRSTFYSADYASDGAEVPTTSASITGIINERTGNAYFLTARDANDFSVALSVADNTIDGFSIYPNPSNTGLIRVTTAANQSKHVQIFDMLGKKVIDKNTISEINISALRAGIYIVKVTENNVSATKRLVVK
ncbi:MAG: T9SS type A sorting domain-containing protein [Flavobacteriaceae bacterium]